ncbi:hypothetical protein SBRCBS47491_002100 [Sporothrix bragantina]|uniref:Protein HRI1 n=1 Tax=Sporothrix bragantina TaxID=671064 RepID=A0ABP0B419_9PEZI
MAGISHRVSIAWLPAPHSEPTSTVVLTSPGRRFVDVRVLGTTKESQELDWALAGTSSSTPVAKGVSDCVWRHWVDSHYENEDADAQVDRGRNTDQPDGTVLETGAMVNPATGKVQDYEEVWRDDDLPASSRCVVLQHESDKGDRGVAIVLGPYCQGILRTKKEGVTVERWQRETVEDMDDWKLVFRLGSGKLPCKALTERQSLREGEDLVVGSNQTWTVMEAAKV